jgi:hypothetical protein
MAKLWRKRNHLALRNKPTEKRRDRALLEREHREPEALAKAYDPELVRQNARERWREYHASLELAKDREHELTHEPAKEIVLGGDAGTRPDRKHRQEREGPELDLSL